MLHSIAVLDITNNLKYNSKCGATFFCSAHEDQLEAISIVQLQRCVFVQ